MKYIKNTVLIATLTFLYACATDEPQHLPSSTTPPEVSVSKPIVTTITTWDEFTGRFSAMEEVEVRARVTGFLINQQFDDGDQVNAGDVLFTIDPRPFQFTLEQRIAEYELAEKEYERAVDLRQKRSIAQEEVDRRLQTLTSSKALMEAAKLDLGFTEVKSPINGRISRGFIDTGNLVRENDTVLTRVVSIDPIHINIEASQQQLLKHLRLDKAGKRKTSDVVANPIFIRLDDEENFTHGGRMDFVDNIVDTQTGTIAGRALVPNPDRLFLPGMFAQVRLIGEQDKEVMLIPESALQFDQGNEFVFFVDAEDKVQRAYISVDSMIEGNLIPVTAGLTGDEQVVIAGVQRIRVPEQLVAAVDNQIPAVVPDSMPDPTLTPTIEEMLTSASQRADTLAKATTD